jgi:hypothetical protein
LIDNKYLDLDEADDFGFTFESENNQELLSSQEQIKDLQNRLKAVEKMFLPLLENLMKDPDKEMIKWPNRKPILEKQIKKLKKLTNI